MTDPMVSMEEEEDEDFVVDEAAEDSESSSLVEESGSDHEVPYEPEGGAATTTCHLHMQWHNDLFAVHICLRRCRWTPRVSSKHRRALAIRSEHQHMDHHEPHIACMRIRSVPRACWLQPPQVHIRPRLKPQSTPVQCRYDTVTALDHQYGLHIIIHTKPLPLPAELPDLPDLDDLGNLSFDGSSLAMPSSARTGTPATVTTGAPAAGHRPLQRQASVAHSLGGLFNSMAAASAPMNQQAGECIEGGREREPAHMLLVHRHGVQCQLNDSPCALAAAAQLHKCCEMQRHAVAPVTR